MKNKSEWDRGIKEQISSDCKRNYCVSTKNNEPSGAGEVMTCEVSGGKVRCGCAVNCVKYEMLAKIMSNLCKMQNVSVKTMVWLHEMPIPFAKTYRSINAEVLKSRPT